VTLKADGANVAVVSRHATRIFVSIYDMEVEVARLPLPQRLGDVHYGFIAGLREGMRYGLRAEGPWKPEQGHRFDISKLLLDPYALEIDRPFQHDPKLTIRGEETEALVPKAIVKAAAADARSLPPHRPRFIYEVPVRAFTMLHPQVPENRRGTVAALAEPVIIDHLKRLGVDTVELMPVTAWIDERHLQPLGLHNAWGYNPVSFFAPDPRLAPGGLAEIRASVDALHAEGIRVILDVVFNHSGESDEFGATLSFRGLDNALYYRHADSKLVNDTGCGNTLALDRRPVMQLAMDAMRCWVTRTGLDGFRFDLAPVMGRNQSGFDCNAPLLAAIEQDPLLSQLIMIAEPWDVGPGGYRLGQFPARWMEWNDHYRDDVRRFWRGDAMAAGALATRITGSSDVFAPHRRPSSSINFVAAHDGFTLRDSVTYAVKDNHANGEGNRDGNSHEPSWPGGDARVLLATLFLSRGTPMLTAGDEFGRTQRGNNNAYAQDNEITWLDWKNADHDLTAFVAELAKLRSGLSWVTADTFLTGATPPGEAFPDAQWVGADGGPMNWERDTNVIGLVLSLHGKRVALLFNRGRETQEVSLPQRDGFAWRRTSAFSRNGSPSVDLYTEERTRSSGVSDSALVELAEAAGVSRDWWEVDGTHHLVSAETHRALLTALRIPHATPDDVEAARRMLLEKPSPIIARAGIPVELSPASPRRRHLTIEDESGNVRSFDVRAGQTLAVALDAGYHVLRDSEETGTRHVIVSPGACWLPDDIARGKRVWGLASHLYALRHKGGEGIGDFETLRRFASMTREAGGRYAGLNPLHHLFPTDRSRASPYQPSDRRFIDPIYISIEKLLEDFESPKARRLALNARAAFAKLETLTHVDYEGVWAAKAKILETAFAELLSGVDLEDFIRNGGEDLKRHGEFETRLAGEKMTPQRIRYRAFLQWVAERQLGKAASHRNLYRDLALGCAFDGGEIAEAPDRFANGVSIGAPPDPFSAAGQVWNLPPFSPLALAQQNFEPMRAILEANMRHAAALRIDHILGFARQFWVPRGSEGRFGAYVKFPMEALIVITAIESHRAKCLVVGEDLGTIPDGLRDSLTAASIFSYRVLWFEREGRGFKPPEQYPSHALACLASHDLPTFRGWRAGIDISIAVELGQLGKPEAVRRRAERAAEISALDRLSGADKDPAASAHALVARTPSQIMLVQADDLSGETEPLNVPGTDAERPNWRRRLSVNVEELMQAEEAKNIIAAVKAERPS
jgi:glycogen debranching enzyme GlgX